MASCTGIQDSLHTIDSGFQVLDSGPFVGGTWIPDSNRKRDSGFLELNSGFHSKNLLDSFIWS